MVSSSSGSRLARPFLINAIGALVFALLVPYIAIGRTLLYCLQLQAEREPAKRWRERLPGRRSVGPAEA